MPLYNDHTIETPGTVADAEIVNTIAANALIRADGETLIDGDLHGHARAQTTTWTAAVALGIGHTVTFPGFHLAPALWLYWRKTSGATNREWSSRGWGIWDLVRARFECYTWPFAQVDGTWQCEVRFAIPSAEAGDYEFLLIAVGV